MRNIFFDTISSYMKRLDHYWYSDNLISRVLIPLSWLFRLLVKGRQLAFHYGVFKKIRLPVPVLVVGNITVGGSGKTPMVLWLADFLKSSGYQPGIISRGYGGQAKTWPQQVNPASEASLVGDEAVLMAQRSACPMVVGPDRAAAAQLLLENSEVDIIISDDGMQHYRLARDVELALIDGERRLGNERSLPAGPLRERPQRLDTVDFIINNGKVRTNEIQMILKGSMAVNLSDEHQQRTLESFSGQQLHAIAGIGNPGRFFNQLREAGLDVIEHPFSDHYRFRQENLQFNDGLQVLMTEKDVVKCHGFAEPHYWYLPVTAELPVDFGAKLLALLKER